MKAGIYTANTTAQAVGANSALPLGSIIRRFGCYNLGIVGMVRRCCSAPGTLTLMANLAGTVNNVGLIVGKVA